MILNETLNDAWNDMVESWIDAVALGNNGDRAVVEAKVRALVMERGGIQADDGTAAGEVQVDRAHFLWLTPDDVSLYFYGELEPIRRITMERIA